MRSEIANSGGSAILKRSPQERSEIVAASFIASKAARPLLPYGDDLAVTPYCAARWRIEGPPLPIENAIEVGALARKSAMGVARRMFGAANLPSALAGHGLPDEARHEHLYYLPEDADGDGCIDHIVVFRRGGLDNRTLRVLVALRRLWAGPLGEWRVIEHWIARAGEPLGSIVRPSRVWVSATPFLCPRHVKPGFSAADQIRWQCAEAELPPPECVEPAGVVRSDGRAPDPAEFRWTRIGSQLRPPDRRGGFWRIVFPSPVAGPVALGFGCHFGLGAFRPAAGA